VLKVALSLHKQQYKISEHPISHSGTVWAYEQSTEHPLYQCRGGCAAEDVFQQVTEYLEIGVLLDRLPRVHTVSWTWLPSNESSVLLDTYENGSRWWWVDCQKILMLKANVKDVFQGQASPRPRTDSPRPRPRTAAWLPKAKTIARSWNQPGWHYRGRRYNVCCARYLNDICRPISGIPISVRYSRIIPLSTIHGPISNRYGFYDIPEHKLRHQYSLQVEFAMLLSSLTVVLNVIKIASICFWW